MSMSGECLNSIIVNSGPEAGYLALWKQSGPYLKGWIPSLLWKLNCSDPPDHVKLVLDDISMKTLIDFRKYYEGKKKAGYTNPHSWLTQIGHHCAVDHSKEDTKYSDVMTYFDSDEVMDNFIYENSEHYRSIAGNPIDDLIYKNEVLKHLGKFFLKNFSSKEQGVMKLWLKEKSHKIVAREFGLTLTYSHSMVSRMTWKLRQEVIRISGGEK